MLDDGEFVSGHGWSWWIAHARYGNDTLLVDPYNQPLPGSSRSGIRGGTELTPDFLPDHLPSYFDLVAAYLAGLRQIGLALQAVEGRKHVLLYSPGVSAGMSNVPDILDRIDAAEALRDADAGVHSLNTDRVGARESRRPREPRRGRGHRTDAHGAGAGRTEPQPNPARAVRGRLAMKQGFTRKGTPNRS